VLPGEWDSIVVVWQSKITARKKLYCEQSDHAFTRQQSDLDTDPHCMSMLYQAVLLPGRFSTSTFAFDVFLVIPR
jgi:hypothetical protein